MIQRGSCLGLAAETAESLGVQGDIFGKKFEGHEAMQPGVFGLINHAHSPTAEFFDDAVLSYGLANHCANLTWVKRASQ